LPSLSRYRREPGLSIEARQRLRDELEARIKRRRRLPGRRALVVTPCDGLIFEAIEDCYNGASGACCPGMRTIAREAGVSLGAVSIGTKRLRAAGWLYWRLTPRKVDGALRFLRIYSFPPIPPPEDCSSFGTKPGEVSKGQAVDKSQPHRVIRSRERQLETIPAEAAAVAAAAAAASREARILELHRRTCEARRNGERLTL
jgi:hypothetical protein